jgi:hypothetical protein
MDHPNANVDSHAPAPKTEKITKATRSNSAPANLGGTFVRKSSEVKKVNKPDRSTEWLKYCVQQRDSEQSMPPSLEVAGDYKSRTRVETGGVPMERQFARRGEVGRRPPTGQSSESGGHSTAMKEQSQQA